MSTEVDKENINYCGCGVNSVGKENCAQAREVEFIFPSSTKNSQLGMAACHVLPSRGRDMGDSCDLLGWQSIRFSDRVSSKNKR